ncbi:hypothetical protein V500_05728 [Pseudogymnoascus sp. VKM F-4518 (FW-2643)]|nr:hypothetical protein V500_05728 [Pseudogymnoascus sp. VKM F-4518 (FW-2643)]KFZ17617.1 hypothetical protein V502_04523 [Pseudogymnoascus sp. VKM F-4520 (FW-2644)]
MLLDEDPATLIHHTIGNFNIQPDKLAVSRINESLSTLQQARDLRLREAENSLKKLSRTLNTLQNNHQETVQSHSATAHSSLIAELDTQKFRVAKSFSSLEIETDHLSTQLADLKAQLQELELQGVDGGEEAKRSEVEDEVLLKLRVYRSLGIEAEREGGEWSRAVVRGKGKEGRSGEVQVVNVEKKFSKFFYANYFWQAL